jgi:hypothetical protein
MGAVGRRKEKGRMCVCGKSEFASPHYERQHPTRFLQLPNIDFMKFNCAHYIRSGRVVDDWTCFIHLDIFFIRWGVCVCECVICVCCVVCDQIDSLSFTLEHRSTEGDCLGSSSRILGLDFSRRLRNARAGAGSKCAQARIAQRV